MDQLVLVYEPGNGLFREDIQPLPIQCQEYIAEGSTKQKPPNYNADLIAIKMARSYIAMKAVANHRDGKGGLPIVLNFTVVAKSLDRVE